MAQVKPLKLNGGDIQQTSSSDDITFNTVTVGASGDLLKNVSGELQVRNAGDSADANLKAANITASGTLSVTGNATITGDLTVNGTTTTVNSETLTVADNIIILNSNVTGTPSENAGIEVERGTSTNASVTWNETSDRWTAGITGSETAIVLVDTTDTLTNKTINAANNTITNIGASESEAGLINDQSTLSGAVDTTNDFLLIYDASTTSLKKVSPSNLGTGGEANTASNVGGGTGIFKQKTGVDLEFKTLTSTDSSVTITGNTSTVELSVTSVASAGQLRATYTAGTGGIAAFDVVYVSANNTVLKADADGIATGRAIGIAPSAITAAASGAIVTSGLLAGVGSGWTAGSPVYLSTTAGGTTQTAPTGSDDVVLELGIAKNATDLQIDIKSPIILS